MTQQLVSPAHFSDVAHDVADWARTVLHQLDTIESQYEDARRAAADGLEGRIHPLDQPKRMATSALEGCIAVRLPAGDAQGSALGELLRRHAVWSEQSAGLRRHSGVLREALAEGLNGVSAPARGGLFRRHRAHESALAVDRLRQLADWGDKSGFCGDLRTLAEQAPRLDEGEGLATVPQAVAVSLDLPVPPGPPVILPAAELAALQRVLSRGANLLETRQRVVQEVRRTFEAVRERMVARRLKDLPVSTIKDASKGQVRTTAVEAAGVLTVQQVIDMGTAIERVPGVGHQTATQLLATARALHRTVKDDLKLRIDLDEKDSLLTSLVVALHVLLDFEARVDKHREELDDLLALLTPLRSLPPCADDVILLHRHSPRRGADLTRHLMERSSWVRESGLDALLGEDTTLNAQGAEAWDDFKRRAAEYYGLLGELVGIAVDVEAAQGHLPREVVEAVHRQDLDTSRLKASLRGYQAFGARYALVQRRVIVGDEMGLGKTVQALAVMAHLAANGAGRFLVVCPTAVLVNWTKEIRKHSHLEPVRLHGAGREQEWRRWQREGGVAVTSYQTLLRLPRPAETLDLLVADEAHLVKNPAAQRSRAIAELVERSGRTLFLTGTPLENRVEEFQNLVAYLQPEVAGRLEGAEMVLGAHKFREAVAPVYLRRNSDDVLSELPELVETEEWLEFTDIERDAYVDALGEHAFQEMRRVAFTADLTASSKQDRLEEIVEEAFANDLKVVVFTYFRDVLDAVAERLGDRVVGIINGSTSADGRQALADAFTESTQPAVLLSQIVAGGVGMNLQAASVVILCEPQVKPALEDQAIKRAHRMGQVRTVQVHRLLTVDSVDERMQQILGQKSEIFAQYAAQSDVAAASPEAVDITEAAVAKQVLAQEQERYAAELRARQGTAPLKPAEPVSPPEASGEADDGSRRQGRVLSRPGSHGCATRENSTPSTANAPKPQPKPAPHQEVSRQLPQPHSVINKCNSCNQPYDFNGHCGCS